ncbi:MAG: EF-hand domain-containing protein [Bacteroidales bacterium]|nr:EF-hand domain-containing protein [Bacteroidales bacterium]
MRAFLLMVPLAVLAAVLLPGRFVSALPEPSPKRTHTPHRKATPPNHSWECLLLDSAQMRRVRLDVTIQGRAVSQVWDDVFSQMAAFFDRNHDGQLNRTEAQYLPSAFSWRQLLWGRSVPYTGQPIPWSELATHGQEQIQAADLARYYRSVGVGNVSIAYGKSPSAATVSAAMTRMLDRNGDQIISRSEWQAAPTLLMNRDRNGDERISAGELVSRVDYPGSAGMRLVFPLSQGSPSSSEEIGPIVLLPTDQSDTAWADTIVRQRDKNRDGQLDAEEAGLPTDTWARLDTNGDKSLTARELASWRSHAPDASWSIEMGAWEADGPTVHHQLTAGATRFVLRGDRGQLPAAMIAARQRLLAQFAEVSQEGNVRADELSKRSLYDLQQLLTIADRDGNGQLSLAEVKSWLALQEAAAQAHVLVKILDHGHGWFERLDTNADGGLSRHELQTHAEQLASEAGYRTAPPRHMFGVVSRGLPQNTFGKPTHAGPAWFRAMDRNQDGVVSRSEFVGPAHAFEKRDQNRDGVLSADEVE